MSLRSIPDTQAPIDWERVVSDIAVERGAPGIPLGTRGVAKVLMVSRGTIRNVLDCGGEPTYTDGVQWIVVWCECMRRDTDQLPRRVRERSAATC